MHSKAICNMASTHIVTSLARNIHINSLRDFTHNMQIGIDKLYTHICTYIHVY